MITNQKLSRRDFLWLAGMTAAGMALAACAPPAAPPAPAPTKVAEAPTPAPARTTDEIAVEAARQFAGQTFTVSWEAGLQTNAKALIVPEWEELTGTKINWVEISLGEMAAKFIAEHAAKTGAYDVLWGMPMWNGDMVSAGVIRPIDDFIEKYYTNKPELDDFHPAHKEYLMKYAGKTYGIPIDGDVFLCYYRKDIFEEYGLALPKTWKEFDEIGSFITEKLAPKVYGGALMRGAGINYWTFYERYRDNGGKFFDPNTMDALIGGEPGPSTLKEMNDEFQWSPPGAQKWGFMECLTALFQGQIAMTQNWPPFGRWAEKYGTQDEKLKWVPPSEVAGKIGYFPSPIGAEMAGGHSLWVSSDSKNPELAYLFTQWVSSPKKLLELAMSPITLIDPVRLSTFDAKEYREKWPGAGEYLDGLRKAADQGLFDLFIPGATEYADAVDKACTAVWAGGDPAEELQKAANEWNKITDRLGRDQQKAAYQAWAASKYAYPKT